MDRFEEAKLRVKEATDLVELIQGYVPLIRRGRNFVACCPFHAEKTPSFTVHTDTQHFKCYGCGKAGDAFTFLMERDGIPFRDAFEQLAERARIPLDGVFGRGDRPRGPRVDVHGALAQVRELCAATLRAPEGAAARAYLDGRGLLDGVDGFGLGLHPRPGELRRFATANKLPVDVLVDAGLLGRDGGREPLAGRVIFPIVDDRGRVVAFGGRVLPGTGDEGRPKYINSPESRFFEKRRLLYGMRQVKDAAVHRVIVVEGYTDVIACHLAGVRGAVATLGTSLTVEHARALERWATDGVILLFDGDRAGRQAADRAFRELVHTTLRVKIALLPEGVDPADLARGGSEALEALLATAEDALAMWFRLLRQRFDFQADADVQRAAAECRGILADVQDQARQQALQRNMARHLGLDESALRPKRSGPRALARAAAAPAGPAPTSAGATPAPARPAARTKLEELDVDLVACLCVAPELRSRPEFAAIAARDFALPRVADLLSWIEAARVEGVTGIDAIAKSLFAKAAGDPALQRLVADAVDRARRLREPEGILQMLRQGRQIHFAQEEARRVRAELHQALAAKDRDLADRLTGHYMALLRAARETPATSG